MKFLGENGHTLWSWLRRGFWLLLIAAVVQGSTMSQVESYQYLRRYTRQTEFDFTAWTMDAAAIRWGQFSRGTVSYLDEDDRIELVKGYFSLTSEIRQAETMIALVYTDPGISDPEAEAAPLIERRDQLLAEQDAVQEEAESILAEQTASVLAGQGIGILGVPIPPVAFHISDTPYALIVSPRDVIRQDASIQLGSDLSLEDRVALEELVEREQDVSALVVATGGIGIYPTMVLESTSQPWILEVIAHEWTHNYLTLHPLGLKYGASNDLRTMNETTANLIGKDISRRVLERYYPDLLPSEELVTAASPGDSQAPAEPVFDFNAEMRETRMTVDELLLEGNIEEAERYMEQRREFFWDHGYAIRKLNQAYFAFHGAYADSPGGGAAGVDPVGEAVRTLWNEIGDPADFLRRMSWMDSTDDLIRAVQDVR